MTDSPAVHVEIERSYDAPEGAAPPDLVAVAGVAGTQVLPTRHLDATYFDTADLALARSRTTLRRRTGGADDGWHLKRVAAGDGQRRTELQAPLADELPAALAAEASKVTTEPLAPLVRVRNDRTTTLLLGAGDRVLAEVCHDRVRTEGLRPGVPDREWVEWEVELADGDDVLLDRVEEVLLAAGGRRLALASKLARALGPVAGAKQQP